MHVYSHEHYDKKVKIDANKAIHTDNITDHGPKLNKHLAVTQEKFETESDEVKEDAGKMPKVDENTKVKAIRELGPMLDHIFHYISHVTDGWKFSVLMAGPDPTNGATMVYDYHIGELDNGIQFNTFCDQFNVVQECHAVFEATLPQGDDSDEDDSDNNDNNIDNDADNNSEMDIIPMGMDDTASSSGVAVGEINNPVFHTDNLYCMSPDSESWELEDQHSALPNDFGSMELGCLLDGVTEYQHSMLPHQLDFQHHDLNIDQLGSNADDLTLTAANSSQFRTSPLDLFTPNFVNTANNLTTGPQIQVPPLDSLIPNFATTAKNLTTGPRIQAPFVSISDMPFILPPPPTRPQTPHATDVCLPAVPDEVTSLAGPDLDVAVPSPPNRR
ncbi:hypothetical protein BDR07DRAFT_1487438 [Suillus spraguei]|nr:hypothetical protein BDR07DRAFT_1487438 [Suillus spraguei]